MSDDTSQSWDPEPRAVFDAVARLIRALAPEICGVSFHDQGADTLWLSDDFLLPEDHSLVEDSLADREALEGLRHGDPDDARYAVALPITDCHGEIWGAVRLTVDPHVRDPRITEPLEQRMGPVIECLAAEYARRAQLANRASALVSRVALAWRGSCAGLLVGQADGAVALRLKRRLRQ